MQVSHREFDVVVLALSGTGFRRQQPATVDVLKVAPRELVAALPVLVPLALNPEMPPCMRGDPVPLDVVVLLPGRGLVLAPCVTVIDHVLAHRDQVPRVVESPLVPFDRHAFHARGHGRSRPRPGVPELVTRVCSPALRCGTTLRLRSPS